MGSSGTYYDRDVTVSSRRFATGYSDVAQNALSKKGVDGALLPVNRRLSTDSETPIVYAFDVTGSMQGLPRIIYDKMPMIAGQIVECGYLQDPRMSVAAVGDTRSDRAPIQICDFSEIRNLDEWLTRVWLEAGGGGGAKESYEFFAYYYARMVDMPRAVTPIFLFTGDEGFYERILAKDLQDRFGGQHETVRTEDIFKELIRKFKGNVFLIHRAYSSESKESEIVTQWESVLGKERIVHLPEDLAIADVTLGVFALVAGGRTLDKYLEDMARREQTTERMKRVKESLTLLASSVAKKRTSPKTRKAAATATTQSPKKRRPEKSRTSEETSPEENDDETGLLI